MDGAQILPDLELAIRIATALAIGLVVGIERGWRERAAAAGSRTAGVRTYALAGLLGGICGALSAAQQTPILVGFGFLGFAFVFAAFKLREAIHDGDFSVTGVVAALVVFLLGAYAVLGNMRIAAAAGAAVAGLLASREMLHGFLARLTWIELRSALLILTMTVIVLPLLPDRAIDPWNSLNPREIWLFAILVAAISYSGYVALKLFPPHHGIALAAAVGAIASSTAVTLVLARRSKTANAASGLAGGACLAAMVSALRVLLLVALLKPSLALLLAPSAVAAALTYGLAGIGLLRRSSQTDDAAIATGNPFELPSVLTFAALFAFVSVSAQALIQWFGASGLLAVATIAAIADVDAAALAAVRTAGTTATETTAANAILLAIAINAIARNAYAFVLGERAFALLFAAATLVALAALLTIYLPLRP
jgi:uncharacterized membrane protein (DUF4010 family)